MTGSRYVRSSGIAVELGGGTTGGTSSDQYPSNPLSDEVDAATSIRTPFTITASATPHTLGTAVELDASLSDDASGLVLFFAGINTSATDSSSVLVISIGAGAGTVWAKVPIGYTQNGLFFQLWIPGFIAAGTRVIAQLQSAIGSAATTIVPTFLDTKSVNPGAPATYGVNLATSRGVTLTPHASLNTKGAWTQIAAATSVDHTQILLRAQGAAGTAMNTTGVLVDIGIGGSGSESVLIKDIYLLGNNAEYYAARSPYTYGVDIPSGSRLSARFARANVGNTIDIALIGA